MLLNGKGHMEYYMEYYIALIIIFIVAIVIIGQIKNEKKDTSYALVTYVYDGDTVQIQDSETNFDLRLVGIDAPEMAKPKDRISGQIFSIQAKNQLIHLILDKKVHVKFFGYDPYGRLLGEIYLEKINVNLEMVRLGLAEVYSGPYNPIDNKFYLKAEKYAQKNNLGIWQQKDEYVSPWVWRKFHK
jgi:micrococcal nuclease